MSEDGVSDGGKCSPEEEVGVGVRNSLTSVTRRVSSKCYVEQRLGRGEERVLRQRSQPGLEGAALRPGSALHSPWPLSTCCLCCSCFHYINSQWSPTPSEASPTTFPRAAMLPGSSPLGPHFCSTFLLSIPF